MKVIKNLAVCLILFLGIIDLHARQNAISKQEYMAYITAASEYGWNDLEASRERWRNNIDLKYVFGYNPPGNDIYLAALSANLYEITKESKYLDRAKELLLYYGKYRDAYPSDFHKTRAEYGEKLPALPNIFTFGKYVHAYASLQKHASLSKKEQVIIEQNIAESADYLINFQEWGPMNRAMALAVAFE